MAYSKITIALMLVLLVFMARGTYSIYQKERDAAAQRDLMQQQFATLQARETVISADVQALQTNTGLDKALREKFGVAAAGESVAVIVDATATDATTAPPVQQTFFQKFWSAVTDIL